MGDYQGISSTLYDEPEYETSVDLAVAGYLMTTRDMLGVCPIHLRISAAKCRTSIKKFKAIIRRFERLGKLIIAEKWTHIWWKSGAWHSLYKGKCSDTQAKSVGCTLKKWNTSGVFGNSFAVGVLQHYDTKYNYVIPYPYPTPTLGSALMKQKQNLNQKQKQTGNQKQKRQIVDNPVDEIKSGISISSVIESAYLKRFGDKLAKEDRESLLKKYGDEHLLLMMIRHITINNEIKSPVGLLMIARDAPGSHLPDNQYDNWVRERRNVASKIK